MTKEMKDGTLGKLLGNTIVEWEDFDISEALDLMKQLKEQATDLDTAEKLQQKALYIANILSEYVAQLNNTITHLDSKLSALKAKTSLDYKAPDGAKVTAEQRKLAAEANPDVEDLNNQLGRAKGAKTALIDKSEIILKAHHHYKEMASGMRRLYGASTQVGGNYGQDEVKPGVNTWGS